MTKNTNSLAGVVAGESAISSLDEKNRGLSYRGYSIYDLVEQGSFEEVAYLLTRGNLPNAAQLRFYLDRLIRLRTLPAILKNILELLPAYSHPMDVLRSTVSVLGSLEPESEVEDQYVIPDRLVACFPSALLYWYHFHIHHKKINTDVVEDTMAGYFLTLLHGKKPDELQRKALDVSLMLYAEHEFNTSTFVTRITTSTQADFYSAICAGISALSGPLHGGANEAVLKLIQQFNSPQNAEESVRAMLAKKELIMGFGQRAYAGIDPRSDMIKVWAKKLSEQVGDKLMYAISERIEQVMRAEKKLFPNIDFYTASTYYFCGVPSFLFTPLFALARLSGWSAHIFEQRANNRLIRPVAQYIGPPLKEYLPLEKR